jgi:hypothetical protein
MPVLRAWLKLPRVLVGTASVEVAPRREDERSEGTSTDSFEERIHIEDKGAYLQSRRRASPR